MAAAGGQEGSMAPPLRADARRNRERIVTAAGACFATEGMDCQVAEVARRAGVGNATVFRHFPTKQDLIMAVIEARMREMLALSDEAAAMPDAETALRRLLDALCRVHVHDHGLKEMAAEHFQGDQRLVALRDDILDRLATLVERAKAAGVLRDEVSAVDLAVLVNGVAAAVRGLEERRPGLYRRYLEIALAGMRPPLEGAPALPSAAPTPDEVDAAWNEQARLRGGGC
jgi:AcrR family transcriptional regulator